MEQSQRQYDKDVQLLGIGYWQLKESQAGMGNLQCIKVLGTIFRISNMLI